MASISTSQFLDNGTARTAGEAWTMDSGATLTVRTDSRWHANAPASMTGTLSTVGFNLPGGGGLLIDGTKVRWLPFDTGSSTVPAIGTTITQGGVSGYLLGVWSALNATPLAVGAAMPATGFLKFREITGGAFAAGALTGISANATAADVTGWIEVVFDQSTIMTFSAAYLGAGYTTTGEWFFLDNTTGTPGQIFQVPTNGGGAGTDISAIQVETAPGSNVYEWWPCSTTAKFLTTALTTDARAKVCQFISDGQVRMGSNGTTNIGFTAPSGCKVRIPNILVRQCTTGARATNVLPSTSLTTRPRFSGITKFNLSKTYTNQYFVLAGLVSSFTDVALEGFVQVAQAPAPVVMTNCVVGFATETNNGNLFSLSSSILGATFTGLVLYQQNAGSSALSISASQSLTFTDLKIMCGGARAAGNAMNTSGSGCKSWTFTNTKCWGGSFNITGVDTCAVTNFDYIERLDGPTATTLSNTYMISMTTCVNITVDTVTWGNSGTLANCHPLANNGIIYVSSGGANIKVRNIGTVASPLSVGATTTTWPLRLVGLATNVGNSTAPNKFQRFFVGGTRASTPISTDNATQNCIFEQIGTYSTVGLGLFGYDNVSKGTRGNGGFSSSATSPQGGMFVFDNFMSDTAGQIYFGASQLTAASASYCTYSLTATTSSIWSTSGLLLRTSGDFFQYDLPYFIKGHTAFANTAPTINATNVGNHLFQYQIDTGSGWNGTFKTLNAANLSAETISASVGFKLRIKVSCTVTSTSNAFTFLTIPTVSTLAAQSVNLYDLETSTLTFTGLVAGSEVRCYTGTDPATAVEIGGTESSGTSFSFSHSNGGSVGYIRIFALGRQPVNYDPYTYAATDTSILVQQAVDRNYVNP